MSDQSAPEGQEPEASATQEAQQPEPPEWLAPIQDRMNELSESTNRLAEQFASQQQQPQAAEEEDPYADVDLYDDTGDLTPEGAQALIDQRVDERLQNVLSTRDAERALDEREDAFDALREDVEAFQDDKYAAQMVREVAADLEAAGRPDLIETPYFVDQLERYHKARQFDERTAAEREQSNEREVVLEGATGASQPQTGKEPDWGDRIVKAAERMRPQI